VFAAGARGNETREGLGLRVEWADEVAVAAFLEGRLAFLGIAEVIERVLDEDAAGKFASMEDVLAADAEARRVRGKRWGVGGEERALFQLGIPFIF